MVGATECNYYTMMGLDFLGSEYKAGNLTRAEVEAILRDCFRYDLDAVADFFTRYSNEEPPSVPEPEPDPPIDLPEEGDEDFVGPVSDPEFYEELEDDETEDGSREYDTLLVVLGAIVLGMVFYYTLNTTKEAL